MSAYSTEIYPDLAPNIPERPETIVSAHLIPRAAVQDDDMSFDAAAAIAKSSAVTGPLHLQTSYHRQVPTSIHPHLIEGELKRLLEDENVSPLAIDLVLRAFLVASEGNRQSLAEAPSTPHDIRVIVPTALVAEVLKSWDEFARDGTALTPALKQQMAEIALALSMAATTNAVPDLRVIDPVSRLELPIPAPPVLYQDRPANELGRKPTIEEWLDNDFWKPWKDRCLISPGDLLAVDPHAYKALHQRARVLATREGCDLKNLRVEFFRKNGVLAEEVIANPSDDLRDRVALIKLGQARRRLSTTLRESSGSGTK